MEDREQGAWAEPGCSVAEVAGPWRGVSQGSGGDRCWMRTWPDEPCTQGKRDAGSSVGWLAPHSARLLGTSPWSPLHGRPEHPAQNKTLTALQVPRGAAW